MAYYVEKAVLDAGVKTVFAEMHGIDNHGRSDLWDAFRAKEIERFYEKYKDLDVHADPIIEGFNILHDKTGVKRRKNIPSTQNLIKLLVKNHDLFYVNRLVDIYNICSLETKLSFGAHDMSKIDGDVTLRFTDGTERFQPLGQPEPKPINPHEYSYIDSSNEVLCRLEIRQVEKTSISEDSEDVLLLVLGHEDTTQEYLDQAMQDLIDMIQKYCGGFGEIVQPEVY